VRIGCGDAYGEGADRDPAGDSPAIRVDPGTQVEFVDEGGAIRLVVRRRVPPSDAGGRLWNGPSQASEGWRPAPLADFDPASLLKRR
jgi:hypothetical protein